LPLLRVQPVVGLVFGAEDEAPGNPLRAARVDPVVALRASA
jgi:hypothetical protein